MFTQFEGWVLLRQKQTGTFRIANLYELNGEVFASHGGGYIRLRPHHATSNPNVFWERLESSQELVTQKGNYAFAPEPELPKARKKRVA